MGVIIGVIIAIEQAATSMIPGIHILLVENMISKVTEDLFTLACISRFCSYRHGILCLFGKEVAGLVSIEIYHSGITIPGQKTVSPEEPGILLLTVIEGDFYHIVILFAAGILGSAVSGIFSPAAGALLPHIIEEEQLQQGNSYFSIRSSLQSILGVVLAGVLYAALDIRALFLIVGLSYVASGVSEMFIRYEHTSPEEKLTLKVALADMGEGLRYIKAQKAILAMMSAIVFINFFFSPS